MSAKGKQTTARGCKRPIDEALAGPTVLFDGDCVLCSGFVDFILERERAAIIRFCAVQSEAGQVVLEHFRLPLTDWESNLLIEDGRAYFKSDAYFRILRFLRRPWPWLACGRIVPRIISDWVYDRIARNRYRLFGKRTSCRILDDHLADRFIVGL